jgi:DNA-binding CsgD family transcriptional regulator
VDRGAHARDSLRAALDRTAAAHGATGPAALHGRAGQSAVRVPKPIAASWRRSLAAGLDPGVLTVPHRDVPSHNADLVRLAGPVLDRLAESLDGTGVCLVLGDADGRVAHRWPSDRALLTRMDGIHLAPGFEYAEQSIGTNAIGTALEQRAPSYVVGGQHFADELTDMACAAVPLRETATGRVVGFLDATSRAGHAHPLMLVLVQQAAVDLERVLDEAGYTWPGETVAAARSGVPDAARPSNPRSDLTVTELAVAQLVVLGLTNRATARRLSISPHTVDTHLRHIYRKLGVRSRIELARHLLTDPAASHRRDIT